MKTEGVPYDEDADGDYDDDNITIDLKQLVVAMLRELGVFVISFIT